MSRKIMKPLKPLIVIFIFALSASFSSVFPQQMPPGSSNSGSRQALEWADSVIQTMTLEEKVGQLFMIRAHSNKSLAYKQNVGQAIERYQPGGVCFFQGGPQRQLHWVKQYQQRSTIPLLIAQDAEWGAGMRLDSTLSYPYQMTLGAVQDKDLLLLMGKTIAKELKTLGVNMNFAPVMDVNNNPQNPVINFRSFGEDPEIVYEKAMLYARGMQDEQVIACGKHFPGHGDTDKDSHYTLPVIHSSKEEMHNIHLLPFRKASSEGLGAIMSAHIHVPALDSLNNGPASLSKAILNDLLIEQYNYFGLIVTDALEMAGARKGMDDGELVVKAFLAGNDILLMPANMEVAAKAIINAVNSGKISQQRLHRSLRKILMAKYFVKAWKTPNYSEKELFKTIHNTDHKALIYELYKEALTLLENKSVIPLENTSKQKIALLSVGKRPQPHLAEKINEYINTDNYFISSTASLAEYKNMLVKLKDYDLVVAGMHSSSLYPGSNYGFSSSAFDLLEAISQQTNTIILFFGNPYALKALQADNTKALLLAYENNKYTQTAAVEALFGAVAIKGKLPVSIGKTYKAGHGYNTKKTRLESSSPFFMHIQDKFIQQIDSIALDGIQKKAYPGCQILIAKDNKIFYHKSFGYHTYDQIRPVKDNDLYDLASLTKIAATTLSVMKLSDEGKLNIDQTLSTYFPEATNTNKSSIIIREMMAHQARLSPWIPFYVKTLTRSGYPSPEIYASLNDPQYPLDVAQNLYIKSSYRDTIIKTILDSDLRRSRSYRYSDLGFYLLSFIIEDITNKPLNQYVQESFYQPMGLQHITFKPLEKFSNHRIPPTEDDKIFRHQLVHGTVHDQGAAMLGGVSGHAGLFSNAKDVAALMQMLLNEGTYGGQQFLNPATIKEFTTQQYPLNNNRRGIGFDKPLPNGSKGGPTTQEATNSSFGHSGFTGTYAWADPEYDLVYIFLSNRIYPDAENRKLISMNIRTKIQKVIYDAIQQNG
ncbi:MAG: glycoside hydrolase family 3 N-terminal domain-containing protein [Bacteroidota bacterium]